MIWDVIIIGSGPAGLAAATAIKGKDVLLLEKEKGMSNKLRLSGAGQCNITHGGSINDFKDNYGSAWRFVRTALMSYTNTDMENEFKKYGLPLVTREDLKVFPHTLKSDDVIECLIQVIKDNGVKINTDEEVISIDKDDLFTIKTSKQVYQSKKVIVATGGIGYPKTGSTGIAVNYAKHLGIEFKPYKYALSPIYLNNHILKDLMGLSFSDINIEHFRQKKIQTLKGDLLITHFGFSGPVILNASRNFCSGDKLIINFTNQTKADFEKLLLSDISKHPKKLIRSILVDLPQRFVDETLKNLKLSEVKCCDLKKEDRKKLISSLSAYEIIIDQVGKSHIAMVSSGGILTTQLNKKTYESKLEGLYFIGECVDVDGDTGGYNIQYAFSSGKAAAKHIMEA